MKRKNGNPSLTIGNSTQVGYIFSDYCRTKVYMHIRSTLQDSRQGQKRVSPGGNVIHPFLDGRDTPPRSSPEFLAKLLRVLKEVGNCSIGTIMGRYYAMDRSKNWELTDTAYNCIVCAEGRRAKDP